MKFQGPLLAVKDVGVSRRFYETLLGQRVKYDFGENVTFEGDFSIHDRDHFHSLIGSSGTKPGHEFEMYFEADDIEAVEQSLRACDVRLIHPIQEQPWGQRVIRFYDPDGHIIEVGELMTVVAVRMHEGGLSSTAISERLQMPLDFIKAALQNQSGH